MVKKSLMTMLIASLLGVFVFGGDVWSVVKTAGTSLRNSVKSEVPLEFELQRAQELRKELDPEIRKLMTLIAEQKVEIRQMQKQVDDRQLAMAEQETILRSRNEDLKRNRSTYVYAGADYTPEDVRQDLEVRLVKFTKLKEAQKRDRQILASRKEALTSNELQLDEMKKALDELDVQIAELDNRLKAVQAAETVQNLKYDDTKLSQTRDLLDTIGTQIEVREQLLADQGKGTSEKGLIPTENQVNSQDITTQIDDLLGTGEDETLPASNEVSGIGQSL